MIVLLGAVVLHDGLPGGSGAASVVPGVAWFGAAAMLTTMAVIALVTHVVCWSSGRLIDRRGSLRAVRSAERMVMAGQLLTVLTHVLGVLLGGWVQVVRSGLGIGDIIIVDEIVCILPALMVIAMGWWSFYPIERRLRETVWVRVLEDGHPLYPTPTRAQFVLSNVRHQLLLTLVPLLMIGTWTECTERLLTWIEAAHGSSGPLGSAGNWLHQSPDRPALVGLGTRLIGVALVLSISSLVMRHVWETVRLGDGPLRDRLLALCTRAGVRVRELLVWRTRGTMINGAAMGLIAPLRYILLTDALLDHLPVRQVESVMAHEIAHAKHQHIPWLLFSLIGCVGVFGGLTSMAIWGLAYRFAPGAIDGTAQAPWWLTHAELLSAAPLLLGVFLTFGWISRRFEWQADAFAARHLSADSPSDEPPRQDAVATVTSEAVESMIGALESVATLNHIPVDRRSFRHGSIATRQRKLRALIGRNVRTLPIDRQVCWVKACVAVAVALTIGLMITETVLTPAPIVEHEVGQAMENAR